MEKKPITIKDVEQSVYQQFKKKSKEENLSIGDFFEKMFLNYQKTPDNNEENEELVFLRESIQNVQLANEALQEDYQKLLEEKETLLLDISELKENAKNNEDNKINEDFLLQFEGFDKYIIDLICKQESDRTGKRVTPAMLLCAMFVSYVQDKKFYYFDTPGIFKLKSLKKQYENGELPKIIY